MPLGECTQWVQMEALVYLFLSPEMALSTPEEDCTQQPADSLAWLFCMQMMDGPAHCDGKLDGNGLAGSWGLGFRGQDSMRPLSWPCSAGVRNSFPSLCWMPVGFFFFFLSLPLRVKSWAVAREELRPHWERSPLEPSLSRGWSLSAWGQFHQ